MPLPAVPGNVNMGQLLGQLATTPPVGPIPITPYVQVDVGKLPMPGAGLAGAQTTKPPWTGAPPPQAQAQPTVGSVMQPSADAGRTVGRGDHEINPAMTSPAAQAFQHRMAQQFLQQAGIRPQGQAQHPMMQQPFQQHPFTQHPFTQQQPFMPQPIHPAVMSGIQQLLQRQPIHPIMQQPLQIPSRPDFLLGGGAPRNM